MRAVTSRLIDTDSSQLESKFFQHHIIPTVHDNRKLKIVLRLLIIVN